MKGIRILASLLFLVVLSISVTAVDLNDYSHVSTINVECEEYKGYARFELPQEYLSMSERRSYMDVDHSINLGVYNVYYSPQSDWYVNEITGHSSAEVEKIYDNSYSSTFVSNSGEDLSLNFENPNLETISKVSIDIKDSSLDSITVRDGSRIVPFRLVSQNFHYELFFDEDVSSKNLRIDLNFNGILKIRDVKFYSKQETSPSFGYFYVDNECSKEYQFYFGQFGDDKSSRGARNLPVVFNTVISTGLNGNYDSDFDKDGISNNNDNCLEVANEDQRDINYNGKGDACEDFDRDGVLNHKDNCIDDRNYNQADDDGDGVGNACDDEDGRFFEKNAALVYVFAGMIGLLFIIGAWFAMKKN